MLEVAVEPGSIIVNMTALIIPNTSLAIFRKHDYFLIAVIKMSFINTARV